jgi:hypothetical protein
MTRVLVPIIYRGALLSTHLHVRLIPAIQTCLVPISNIEALLKTLLLERLIHTRHNMSHKPLKTVERY